MSDPVFLRRKRLQVGFHWHADRYAHTVGIWREDRLVPLLASIEGSADEAWPPSPPLQSIHTQDAGENLIALLVGMAGRSHWSVSVELGGPSDTVQFDVACRIKDTPPDDIRWPLMSSYRAMHLPASQSGNPIRVVGDECSLLITAANCSAAHEGEVPLLTDDGFRIPAVIPAGNLPQTIRWRYTITAT